MCQHKVHCADAGSWVNTAVLKKTSGKPPLHWPSLASTGGFQGRVVVGWNGAGNGVPVGGVDLGGGGDQMLL